MSIRNLILKKRSCGQEKEEGVMVVKNKSDETKEESNVLENLKNNHEKSSTYFILYCSILYKCDKCTSDSNYLQRYTILH